MFNGKRLFWLIHSHRCQDQVTQSMPARLVAGRYPSGLEGGCQWRGVICTSRMPPPGHWLVSRDDIELYHQPSGLGPGAENVEHLKARGFFVEIAHPLAGTFKYPGAPVKYGATPWEIRRPGPVLGQHNDEIYGQRLGLSAARLDEFKRTGVI